MKQTASLNQLNLDGRTLVDITLDRIRAYEPPEGYYVAFSGGKDSIVVKDLVARAGVKAELHMNMTSIDTPELVRYVKRFHPDVIRHKPVTSMWKLIADKKMPPTRIARFCCEVLKEGGGSGRFVVTGVRAAESVKRAQRRWIEVHRKDNTTRYLHPILEWSDADVWQYIKTRNLPYCSLYDEGFKRIGCIGCPNGNRKEQFKRWPRWECMYREAIARLAGTYTFDWWMQNKQADNAGCIIFE